MEADDDQWAENYEETVHVDEAESGKAASETVVEDAIVVTEQVPVATTTHSHHGAAKLPFATNTFTDAGHFTLGQNVGNTIGNYGQ